MLSRGLLDKYPDYIPQLVERTRRRRDKWISRENAYSSMITRQPYKGWDARVVRIYVVKVLTSPIIVFIDEHDLCRIIAFVIPRLCPIYHPRTRQLLYPVLYLKRWHATRFRRAFNVSTYSLPFAPLSQFIPSLEAYGIWLSEFIPTSLSAVFLYNFGAGFIHCCDVQQQPRDPSKHRRR